MFDCDLIDCDDNIKKFIEKNNYKRKISDERCSEFFTNLLLDI